MKGGTVLVTGGAGFIGSHMVDVLVREGFRVRVLDNLSSGRLDNLNCHVGGSSVEVLNVDLKDASVVLQAVKDVGAAFHFAANPEVRVSTVNPDVHFNENVVATFNLLEAVRRNDVEELVFASSSSVYGEPESIPVGEDAPIRPVSVYGASKAACEGLMHAYSRLYGVRALVLRYANVVGPRLRHGVVYDFVVKLLRNPGALEVLGDGAQVRSYVHVEDAVEATLIAWRKFANAFEVYNVGCEDWISVSEVADIVGEVMGLRGARRLYKPVLHGVGWPGDVKRVALAVERLKSLGWRPRMKSRQAVSEAARSILQELKGSAGAR
ncbi:MAG: SDR family NAD(P)-dependent oxidoreductase [Candidatus Nezhaarchaeota archaeon]|nr:SDR family NAD(P)-dependent oxidoreductase [Candidatus Nezhaarchaeota archaeon]